MNKTRPKFAVGEEVICINPAMPNRGEITRMEISNDGTSDDREYRGWLYAINGSEACPARSPEFDPGEWASEEEIRKLPPEDRTSWKDCAWQPVSDTEKERA